MVQARSGGRRRSGGATLPAALLAVFALLGCGEASGAPSQGTPAGALAAGSVDCVRTEEALAYWRPVRERAGGEGLPAEGLASDALVADALAVELLSCLGSPDPELRDRIGYELYTYWLRGEHLSDETRRTLLDRLTANVRDGSTPASLSRSFSALVLAELMRSDAVTPFMTEPERSQLLDVALSALLAEADYRGLEPDIGWVHPVAHLSDVLWRFALHPATTAEQAARILDAVRIKAAPNDHGYVFNEGDRLARIPAILFRRSDLVDSAAAVLWLGRFERPIGMQEWSSAFSSPEGMIELHNTKLFIRALSDQLAGVELDPQITEALRALVAGLTGLV